MGCGFVGDETEGMVQSVVGVRERAVVDDKKKKGRMLESDYCVSSDDYVSTHHLFTCRLESVEFMQMTN